MEAGSTTVGPVGEGERIGSLDVLRGVAVLGIFAMNSRNFALPLREFDNPAFPQGPARVADLWVWAVENVFFEDKMIAIFSLLFGAGVVLAAQRAARPAWTHYKRMFWLLVFGLVHAFGLWYGDILNTYAICGAVLLPLRRARAGVLIGLGMLVLAVAVGVRVGPPMAEALWPESGTTLVAEPGAAPGAARSAEPERRSDRVWRGAIEGENAAYHGSWWGLAKWRAQLNEVWHWDGGIRFNFWRCGGLMLIGMGMMKLGVLSAARPASVYWGLMIGGYGAGLALFAPGFWPLLGRALNHPIEMGPDARKVVGLLTWTMKYWGSIGIALGHVGAVMVVCRVSAVRWALGPFAAVGRMALTNYLAQTVVAVIVFDGWAMGKWGTWRMSEIAALVVAVWAVQLIGSPIWLRFMRFGPVEWAWRSLTYGQFQRMRRNSSAAVEAVASASA